MKTYKISDIILDVADRLYATPLGESPTTIRSCIRDALDYWEREGYKVNHAYNQSCAVKRVKKRLKALSEKQF